MTPELIERYAIRCAKGNSGGEWATHYTADQKEFWRKFVRDLVDELGGIVEYDVISKGPA